MIVLVLGLLGAILGGLNAKKRGGNRKDIAQYAAGYALAGIIVGMVITVLIDRVING